MAHILVSWSGGLDSTYLIDFLLAEGHCVDAIYTRLENNGPKIATELKAISRLIKIFEKNVRFKYLGEQTIGEVYSANYLTQVNPWLYVLQNNSGRAAYDYVAVAYVMGDDAISFLDDISKIWDGLNILANRKVPLYFPLTKITKMRILRELPEEIKKHVVWCELGNLKGSKKQLECDCPACIRMRYTVEKLDSRFST